MYAIVEIAGHQFKVEKDQRVFVNRLQAEEGKKVSFDNVLLLGDGDKVTVGAPAIDGAQVGAKVLKHLKGDKVIVFKKKRRKGFRKKNGHRQTLSEIVIESIVASGAVKAAKVENKGAKKATKAESEGTKKAVKVKNETAKKASPVKAVKAAPKAEAKPVKKEEKTQDLSSLTVAELREMAKAKEITGYSSMKKADLIAALS